MQTPDFFSFEDFQSFIEENGIPKVARVSTDEELYQLYNSHVPKEVRMDFLKNQIKNEKSKHPDLKHCLLENPFCHSLFIKYLPNVKHFGFWIDPNSGPDDLRHIELHEAVRLWIIAKYGMGLTFFFDFNRPENKSIPEIEHCHVYVDFTDYDTYYIKKQLTL